MALTTLGLGYDGYYERIRRYLGYPATPNADDEADIHECMDDGLFNFYNAHTWSFLRKRTTIATVASDYDLDLPADFAVLVGGMLHYAADSQYGAVTLTSVDEIDSMRMATNGTNRPLYCAIHAKESTQAAVQQLEILFYPTPDAAYTLTYQYELKRYQIRTETPYPLGNEVHTQTILEAMLCEAELKKNGEIGVHHARMYGANGLPGLLAISINKDNEQAPNFLGEMRDYSDLKDQTRVPHRYIDGDVTYNTGS